jgi:miniconductance mechanosensitive channel
MTSLVRLLLKYGIAPDLAVLVATIIAGVLALIVLSIVYVLISRMMLRLISHLAAKTSTRLDDLLVTHKVFAGLFRLVPPVIIHLFSAPILVYYPDTVLLVRDFALLYMMVCFVVVIFSLLDALLEFYVEFSTASRVPVKSFVQVIKSLAVSIALIVVVSKLIGKSPFVFLGGLGAFTAVLLLVFKNSILGFVAGIQLSSNNLVRVGDWIDMPKYEADGKVIDISLVTVSVQNWDKTISTIPAYALISEGFRNWRGMNESGGRRIKRSLNIDMTSIRFCDDALLLRLENIQLLREYLEKKRAEIDAYNSRDEVDCRFAVNERRLTNIGIFRAYLLAYLHHHQKVNASMTLIIRYLEPTSNGLPIEILVFSREKEWALFEQVQADILDHIIAVLAYFDLRVYQFPGSYEVGQPARSPIQPAGE